MKTQFHVQGKCRKANAFSEETVFNCAHYCPLDCDATCRGSLSFVVSCHQKNSTESESHLDGEFLPIRDDINIARFSHYAHYYNQHIIWLTHCAVHFMTYVDSYTSC